MLSHFRIYPLFVFSILLLIMSSCGPSMRQDYVPEGEATKVEGAEDFAGEYATTGASSKVESVALVLKGNGRSRMLLRREGGQEEEILGEWSRIGQSQVQLVMRHGKKQKEEVLVFETTPEGLKASQFNTDRYGKDGFSLERR